MATNIKNKIKYKKKKKQKGGDNDSFDKNKDKVSVDTIKVCEGKSVIMDNIVSLDSENKIRCSPAKLYDGIACFTLEAMVALCEAFNIYCDEIIQQNKTPNKEVVIKKIDLQWKQSYDENERKKYKSYLVKELYSRLKNVCSNQMCWLKQEFIKKIRDVNIKMDILKNTFRPKAPKGQFTWLGTSNINDVIGQYETKYKHFKFLGAVPMDFDNISDMLPIDIKNLDYDNLYNNGIKQIGIVFNLDTHNKSGSHWVSMFVDLKDGSIEYFDSAKGKPYKRVQVLMNRISDFIKKRLSKKVTIRINNTPHQQKDSECGVYSINFILRRVSGETFDEISSKITDDDTVNLCRNVYFNYHK